MSSGKVRSKIPKTGSIINPPITDDDDQKPPQVINRLGTYNTESFLSFWQDITILVSCDIMRH